ncbi:hypothetical protein [Hydrogenophaga sp.]|uniref:hypothetical protein n=1 Tax=Hydrogenophaga sp. TaxID=1904254 RepID=UPI002AC89C7E|nr:hypothetical protein [Hydrogenophaga sp.]
MHEAEAVGRRHVIQQNAIAVDHVKVVLDAVKVVVMNHDDGQFSETVRPTDLCTCDNDAGEGAIDQKAPVLFAGRSTRHRLKLEHNG